MVYMKPERTSWSMRPKRAEKPHNSNIQYARESGKIQCLNANWVALLVCCAVFQNGGLQHITASIHSIVTNSYIFFFTNAIQSTDAIIAEKKPKTVKPKERTYYFPGKNTAGPTSKPLKTICTCVLAKVKTLAATIKHITCQLFFTQELLYYKYDNFKANS